MSWMGPMSNTRHYKPILELNLLRNVEPKLCLIEHLYGRNSCRLKFSQERGRTMVLPLPPLFPHRQNTDGSFDSICLKCLLTVANARNEADLARCEKYHVCIPSILFQRLSAARTEIVGAKAQQG